MATNRGQDEKVASAPLDELFIEIQGRIERALGKNEDGWPGLKIDAAVRLHDVLLSLRHWGDEIHYQEGTMKVVEEQDHSLASTVRSFLNELTECLDQLQDFYNEKLNERWETGCSSVGCSVDFEQ
jgi:hypothetical protein